MALNFGDLALPRAGTGQGGGAERTAQVDGLEQAGCDWNRRGV